VSVTHATESQRGVLCAVAALSLMAGLIHLWVMPEHFEESWGYGVFFLVAAAAQTFHEVLMKFLRKKEALLVRLSRARSSTGTDAGASNERGVAGPSHQEV
jgi:hypothetical protein